MKESRTFGVLLMFVGYTILSYGIILTRGYNIPVKNWVNPLAPYQWPPRGTKVPTVPSGQIFP